MGSSFCSKKKRPTENSPNLFKESSSNNNFNKFQPTLNREDSFDIDPDYQNNHISNMSSNKINGKKRKLDDESTSDSEPAKKKQKITNKKDGVMTKNEFLKYAKDQIAICGDIKFAVKAKKNKTGSVGYHTSHHDIIKLNKDKQVTVMVGLNATVINSKKWEDGDDLSDNENENENEDKQEDEDEDDDLKDKKDAKEKGDIMTKSEFLSIAKDLTLKLLDQEFTLKPKKAKSGSVGWQLNGLKIKTEINCVPLRLQTSVNITCKNSKEWVEGEDNEQDEDKTKK